MRCTAVAMIIIAATGLTVPGDPGAQPPEFQIELLPDPTGSSMAFDIVGGDSVHVVGEARTAKSPAHATYWLNETPGTTAWRFTLLPVREPERPSRAKKISLDTSPPMIVGYSTELAKKKATLWEQDMEGMWQHMVLPDFEGDTQATGIMRFGSKPIDVLISGFTREPDMPMKKATVWQMFAPDVFELIALPDPDATASWVNDIGGFVNEQIILAAVGAVDDSDGRTLPALWESEDNGAHWTFDTLPVLSGGWGEVTAIAHKVKKATVRDDAFKKTAHATGYSGLMTGELHAVHWDFDGEQWQIHDLGPAPGNANSMTHDAVFEEIDGTHSMIVGESFDKPILPRATLWMMNKGLEAYDLNELLGKPIPGFVLQSAFGYDERDLLIAGYGAFAGLAGIDRNAYVLFPTEPSSAEEPGDVQPRLAVVTHPNPGASEFRIAFRVPAPAVASLTVHDASGRLVARLLDEVVEAGQRIVDWNGRDDAGRVLPSGAYFVRLESTRGIATEKILIAR